MREFLKMVFSLLALVLALPFFIYYRVSGMVCGDIKAFQGASQFFSIFPGSGGMYFRRAFYVLSLKKCSWDSYIGFGTIFSHPTAEIGARVYIGANCTIGDVSFGDYATLGSNVDIMNGRKQHFADDVNVPIQEQGGEYPKVYIGEDAWIGNSAVVMANVGKKAIIGAGSVAVKDVEDYAIAVGNPANVIKKRV